MRRFFVLTLAITLLAVSYSFAEKTENKNSPNITLHKRTEPVKPSVTRLSSSSNIGRVIVKFKENTDFRLRDNKLVSLKNLSTNAIDNILGSYYDNRIKRLSPLPEKEVSDLKANLEVKSGYQLADFNLYYAINVTGPSEAESLVNRLNRLDEVEIAYAEPVPEPAGDIYPPTSDYTGFQLYRNAAPTGVDADYANTQPGGDGSGVKIVDVENYWNYTHEDLETSLNGTISGGYSQTGNHGTAVLGEMIGGDNGYGVTGICPGADVAMSSTATNGLPEAFLLAIDNMDRGDVMLIELHSPGPRYNFEVRSDQLGYICMEYWQANFDAFVYAWAKGIIVCEAAGNGAEDFDDFIYDQVFDTTYRNSHAIVIGAGAPPSGNYGTARSRLDFSNYGERVNLQGYGREVFTTGYGDYWDGDGDPNQWYTASFSGTSSASPIVTGAVTCLQGYYLATYGVPLTADYAREVLVATGTSQTGDTSEHIGPMPDLNAAFAALNAPPSLYAEPYYLDTLLQENESVAQGVWIHNRSGSTAIDFTLSVDQDIYNPQGADWLSTDISDGTVAVADSTMVTVTIDADGIGGSLETTQGMIEFSWGPSGGSLDSLTYLPVYLQVPCADDTTYTPLASDDPDGPIYDWIDITSIGTAISWASYYNPYSSDPLDDGTAGPFTIPFDFPYFDSSYNQIYIGVNGGISFTDENVNDGGFYSLYTIPGDYPMSTFIPVFWNDLLMGTTTGAHGIIYYYNSPTNDSTIIEWWQMGSWDMLDDTLNTFELILTSNGNITMQYQNVGTAGNEYNAVIGLAETGCTVESYFNHGDPIENVPGNMTRIDFTRWQPPVMAGDVNADGNYNILDITYLIAYLYQGGPAPVPVESADVNCDTSTNILDITYLIAWLYQSGSDPCNY